MKKVLALLAFASLVCIACNKTPDDKPDGPDTPDGPAEYEAPITIDGDFADWAKLDASKVATATCDPNATKTALKLVKVYADENNIFVYTEFEVGAVDLADCWIPFHFYMNADNSAATGGDSQEFADKDAEWLLETSITAYDPALFKWWGEVGADGWEWTDPSTDHTADDGWGAILPEGSGIGSSAGTLSADGKGAYEIQIIRDMLSGVEFADTFTLGFDIQVDWSSVGILPNKADGELAPKLVVNVVK